MFSFKILWFQFSILRKFLVEAFHNHWKLFNYFNFFPTFSSIMSRRDQRNQLFEWSEGNVVRVDEEPDTSSGIMCLLCSNFPINVINPTNNIFVPNINAVNLVNEVTNTDTNTSHSVALSSGSEFLGFSPVHSSFRIQDSQSNYYINSLRASGVRRFIFSALFVSCRQFNSESSSINSAFKQSPFSLTFRRFIFTAKLEANLPSYFLDNCLLPPRIC